MRKQGTSLKTGNAMNLSAVIKWIERIPALGIWCSVVSNTLFAFSYVMTKAVVNPDNVFVIGTIRMVIQYSILMPILAKDRVPLFGVKGERLNLFWCALTYIAFHMSIIIAFSMIPAADATAIVAGFPVIVTLSGPCLLGEKFHKIFLFNAFLTIAGVILIDRPSFIFSSESDAKMHLTGVVLAIGAMFWNSGTSIFSKKLTKTSSYTCSTVYPFVTSWGFLLAVIITNQFVFPSCGTDAVVTVMSGVVHSIGTIIYFVAYKYEDAGPLSISGNVESPLVLLMEIFFLGSNPPWTTFVGMALVVIGVVLTAVQKWDAARQAISRKLKFPRQKKKLKVEDPVIYTISYQRKPQN